MEALGVADLLTLSGRERVSILKVDIEGAEAVVFGSGAEGWLPRVDNIVIELHDGSQFGDARGVFFGAIADRGFDVGTSGELTVCRSPA